MPGTGGEEAEEDFPTFDEAFVSSASARELSFEERRLDAHRQAAAERAARLRDLEAAGLEEASRNASARAAAQARAAKREAKSTARSYSTPARPNDQISWTPRRIAGLIAAAVVFAVLMWASVTYIKSSHHTQVITKSPATSVPAGGTQSPTPTSTPG